MTDEGELDLLGEVGDALVALCGTIADDEWENPTPCDDWNLQALVDHVVGGNRFTAAMFEGCSAEEAMRRTIQSFSDDQDSREAVAESTATMIASFRNQGALDVVCHHVAGDITGRLMLRLRLHDLAVHTHDIGIALGRVSPMTAGLLEWGFDEMADPASLTAIHFGAHVPGPGVGGSHGTAADYLAMFGRT